MNNTTTTSNDFVEQVTQHQTTQTVLAKAKHYVDQSVTFITDWFTQLLTNPNTTNVSLTLAGISGITIALLLALMSAQQAQNTALWGTFKVIVGLAAFLAVFLFVIWLYLHT